MILSKSFEQQSIGENIVKTMYTDYKITLYLYANSKELLGVDFSLEEYLSCPFAVGDNDITLQCKSYLEAYLHGRFPNWLLPINLNLNLYSHRVYKVLLSIDPKKVVSYKDLATNYYKCYGLPTSPRAIGQAMRNNTYLIVIPCHKVIRSDGALGGYQGGLKLKSYLLNKLFNYEVNKFKIR